MCVADLNGPNYASGAMSFAMLSFMKGKRVPNMIPMSQAPVEVRTDSRPELAIGERKRQRRALLEDNRRLAAENSRLSEENHALREAATMWIGLYERQLERANDATPSGALPTELSRR